MRHIFILSALLLLSACADSSTGFSAITLTPEAKALRVLGSKEEAAACRDLGEVDAPPPFIFPHDAKHTLRNKAAALGANTIVITDHFIGTANAEAYLCP